MPKKNKKTLKKSKTQKRSNKGVNINVTINSHNKRSQQSKGQKKIPVNLTPQVIYKSNQVQYEPKPNTAENELILKRAEEEAKRAEDNRIKQEQLSKDLESRIDNQLVHHINRELNSAQDMESRFRNIAKQAMYQAVNDYGGYNYTVEEPHEPMVFNMPKYSTPAPTRLNDLNDTSLSEIGTVSSGFNNNKEDTSKYMPKHPSVAEDVDEEDKEIDIKPVRKPLTAREQYIQLCKELNITPSRKFKDWKTSYVRNQITRLSKLRNAVEADEHGEDMTT
jgi:hypothetical protein